MKYLVLIDRKYPYEKGETFIESEMNEISKYFDKIIVYPINAYTKEKQTRNIEAKNVDVSVLNKIGYKYKKYLYFLKSLPIMLAKRCNYKDAYAIAVGKYFSKKIYKDLNNKISFSSKDDIYLYSYWLYTPAVIATFLKEKFLSKKVNCHAISRAHGFDIYEYNHYLPCREYLLQKLDKIVCISKNGYNYLKEKYPEYKEKFTTSYLGTYDHGQSNGSDKNSFNIVSCSRIIPLKRVDRIIEALKIIDKTKPKQIITWYHIGDGDGLEELIKATKESLKNIKFNFVGYLKNSDVYEFYKNNKVDLFINVSTTEGLPVSIMEAISFGIPCIATDVGGTSEIVIDNITGKLIPKDFENDLLAEEIEKIINMKQEDYNKLRKNTRNYWKENYQATINFDVFAKRIINNRK